MTRNINISPLNYEVNSASALRRVQQNRAPTITDNKNFKLGDEWLDNSSNDWYKLAGFENGSDAIWVKIGSDTGTLDTLTGNTGGPVDPDANFNTDLLGTDPITITGTPATNTLTITIADATEIQKGVLETATDAEAIAVTVTDKAIVPSNLGPVFASPPAIGGTAASTAVFTSVTTPIVNSGAATDLDVVLGDSIGANNLTITNTTPADLFVLNTLGQRTMPLQPAVLAYKSTDSLNATGDGTVVPIDYDTEVFDQGGDFNTGTGTFTAPITGRYLITYKGVCQNIFAAHTSLEYVLITSNNTYNMETLDPFAYGRLLAGNDAVAFSGAQTADLDASDTITTQVTVDNGTKIVTVNGTASRPNNIGVYLIC